MAQLLRPNSEKYLKNVSHDVGIDGMMTDDLMREKELEMVNFFRNIMVTGALLGFARYVAKYKRVIG